MEVLLAMILAHLQRHVFAGVQVVFDRLHGVEAVLTGWMIQDEGVCVGIGDEGDQGMRQRFMQGHCHPLRTPSAKTVILVVRAS